MFQETSKSDLFKNAGCRNTKARDAVLDIMKKADHPLSASDIFSALKQGGLSVNLSTVYRTLDTMEKKGIAEKIPTDEGQAKYELLGIEHRHRIVCTSCHKSIPFDECPLRALVNDVGKKTSFDITGHRLELYGLCPDCRHRG